MAVHQLGSTANNKPQQQQQQANSAFLVVWWWKRLIVTDNKMRAALFLWILVLLMLHVASGGRDEAHQRAQHAIIKHHQHLQHSAVLADSPVACSPSCQCEGNSVDCSNRGLTQVPLDLPKDADKM
jgi:hypothetical protein